ncbi:hypothetical protein ABH931_007628 [Streptacidiphilus sp. MAP12-33]|uniref:hypothetical protein n=1 Tax=Streptacidiphilus sp. MAP12-33 TaxID=3156266 RepID=UPI003518E8D5
MTILTTSRTRPMRSPAGLPMLFLLVGVGLLLAWWGGYEAAHAAGLAGTPGTVKVGSCSVIGQGKTSYIGCTGHFRSTDGKVTDPSALVSSPLKLAPGSTLNADRLGAGDYGRISLQRTVGWFALLLLGLSMAATAPASLVGRRATPENVRAARVGNRLGFVVLALFTGAAVFGVMAFVLSFTMA